MSAFKQKMTEVCNNFDYSHLTPDLSEQMTQYLKESLADAGKAAYGSYITSFDCDEKIIMTKGGCELRKKGKVEKAYLTYFGEMIIARSLYQADRGGESFVPLEEKWGMQGHYATIEVREAVAFSAAHCTPEETGRIFGKCALFNPSTTAIKNIVEKVGAIFSEHAERMQQEILAQEQMPAEAEVIAVSADGVNILMREKGGTQRRPAERPGTTIHEEDAQSTYRNAMVGSISFYTGEKDAEGNPQRLLSRYTSAMPQDKAVEFKASFEREVAQVLSSSEAQGMRKVLLMDGSRGLWNYAIHNSIFKKFVPVIDFYHMTEHLSRLAEALFGKQNQSGQAWYAKWKEKMLADPDAARELLRSVDYYSVHGQKLSSSRKKAAKAERNFFSRNRTRMTYAALRNRGIPIGSGPIEAACKSIVKSRMCRSGMRWSRDGGQKILSFRTFVKSDRWNTAWDSYKTYAIAA